MYCPLHGSVSIVLVSTTDEVVEFDFSFSIRKWFVDAGQGYNWMYKCIVVNEGCLVNNKRLWFCNVEQRVLEWVFVFVAKLSNCIFKRKMWRKKIHVLFYTRIDAFLVSYV